MKNLAFAAIALAAALCSACHERKQEPRPDYDGARARSESSHGALDQQKPSGD
ncbi:MAG: hypothetical protein HY079_08515 [Elusimicrobia bacterium]|nr:hypothetical protein [Elusimicrobiota bacterium]